MLKLILSLAVLSATAAHAEVKYCEADCFYLNNAGSSLFYAGKVQALNNSNATAFANLKAQCTSGILLKRTLKSVQLIEIPEFNEATASESVSHYGYGYSVTRTNQNRRVYSLSRPELRATFDTVEATDANACRPAVESDFPAHPVDADGNDIVG